MCRNHEFKANVTLVSSVPTGFDFRQATDQGRPFKLSTKLSE